MADDLSTNRHPMHTFRIHNIDDPEGYDQILSLFDQYEGIVDQIALFMSLGSHPPMPLDTAREQVEYLKKLIKRTKKRGYSCGINLLSTIGHHNENLPNSLNGSMTRMTNIDGHVCMGSFCPNDDDMRRYVKALYTLIVSAKPDFIWIDDDVRFGHMPIGNGCFCHNCISIFNREYHTEYTRKSLKDALNSPDESQALEIRFKWLQHNRNTISRLFDLIEKTVHGLAPDIPLGFMTGERYFEGYDFAAWADKLHGDGKVGVMWRPGGGAYDDIRLSDLTAKAHEIGRQCDLLPKYVTQIQSEIENFPGSGIRKGARSTALEAAMHIAAGCTGTAFNIMPPETDPLHVVKPFLDEIKDTLPFYRLLIKTLGRVKPIGFHSGWSINSQAAAGLQNGQFTNSSPLPFVSKHIIEISELGIPVAYNSSCASVFALSGPGVKVFSEDELLNMLSRGVYIDPEALDYLNSMGYSHLTGFRTKQYYTEDCIEHYLPHTLNPDHITGCIRNARQAFYHGTVAGIEATSQNAQVLADIIDYNKDVVDNACMGVYENELGGRVCVAAYFPWNLLHYYNKAEQLKRIFLWLSKDALPSYIENYARITNWTRQLPDDRIAIVLLNQSLDVLRNITVKVKTNHKHVVCYDMRCNRYICTSQHVTKGYQSFILPKLGAWDMCLMVTKF
jgi:hypothetical protein